MNTNDKITIDTYARGDNNKVVIIGDLKLYFSYQTVIAFEVVDNGIIISENVFSQTTGAHINAIEPDKTKHINRKEFESMLDAFMHNRIGIDGIGILMCLGV